MAQDPAGLEVAEESVMRPPPPEDGGGRPGTSPPPPPGDVAEGNLRASILALSSSDAEAAAGGGAWEGTLPTDEGLAMTLASSLDPIGPVCPRYVSPGRMNPGLRGPLPPKKPLEDADALGVGVKGPPVGVGRTPETSLVVGGSLGSLLDVLLVFSGAI